jgi:putative membrane protein
VTPERRYQATNVALFAVALAHALLTWPPRSTVALFAGGVLLALAAELLGVHLGLVEHALRWQLGGVPVSVLLAWPAVVYIASRVALLLAPAGAPAAAVAAVLATAFDVLTDPNGVDEGVWRYPETAVSEPRFRGVPWWNFLAWLLVVFLTALLPTLSGA